MTAGNDDVTAQRPIPIPDQLTEPFWAAADERNFVIQRCADCRRFHHPPAGICPNCLSTELTFEPVSGRGTVHSYSIMHDPRMAAFRDRIPYTIAIVELEEQAGLVILANLLDIEPDEVRSGMAVTVDFDEIAPGRWIPQFRPA
jgi:hypothetical protein